ncbi:MAG: hypothetical protein JNL57_07185 [Bacteroidetes bacterium]|nr:hypothetical protein [Bacteroidota bacterium]
MKFQINPNTTLREIRQEFHNHFPYLKLEFFEAGHEAGHGTPKSALISDYNQSAGVAETVAWEVNAEMTVKQLEGWFLTAAGLHVQVFRKSGQVWLETTHSDGETLAAQNRKGREHEIPPASDTELPDYHEQE